MCTRWQLEVPDVFSPYIFDCHCCCYFIQNFISGVYFMWVFIFLIIVSISIPRFLHKPLYFLLLRCENLDIFVFKRYKLYYFNLLSLLKSCCCLRQPGCFVVENKRVEYFRWRLFYGTSAGVTFSTEKINTLGIVYFQLKCQHPIMTTLLYSFLALLLNKKKKLQYWV